VKPLDAYGDLQRFGRPVVTTDDAAVRLRVTTSAASKFLARLQAAGLVVRLRRGLWLLAPKLDPLAFSDYLTAPFPSYISFHTALSLHGMVSQIPQVIYVASLARTGLIRTTRGAYSIHHLAPEYFGGFEIKEPSGIKLATPEKALVDVLYLSRARSRLFSRLPELELTPKFDEDAAWSWVARIPAPRQRTMVARRLEAALAGTHGLRRTRKRKYDV